MQYYFMGYNKDRDIYDCLATVDTMQTVKSLSEHYKTMLCKDELKDEFNEPYDWIELWNSEDDSGVTDLIITR